MKFLVDDQLPPALARWISAKGARAVHSSDVGLKGAADDDIWAYALERSFIVVTKDEDFIRLQRERPGAAIVWVTIGNSKKSELLSRFETGWAGLVSALGDGETLVEVR